MRDRMSRGFKDFVSLMAWKYTGPLVSHMAILTSEKYRAGSLSISELERLAAYVYLAKLPVVSACSLQPMISSNQELSELKTFDVGQLWMPDETTRKWNAGAAITQVAGA